jgi:hypothetical protein
MSEEAQEIRYLGDVQRLSLQPGDIIVLRHPLRLTAPAIARVREDMLLVAPYNKVLVLEEGMDIGVLDQRTPPQLSGVGQRTPEEIAEHVMQRVLGTVLYSLAEAERGGDTLAQGIKRLNAALLAEYGLGNQELLSIAAGEALRRLEEDDGTTTE